MPGLNFEPPAAASPTPLMATAELPFRIENVVEAESARPNDDPLNETEYEASPALGIVTAQACIVLAPAATVPKFLESPPSNVPVTPNAARSPRFVTVQATPTLVFGGAIAGGA